MQYACLPPAREGAWDLEFGILTMVNLGSEIWDDFYFLLFNFYILYSELELLL